MSTRRTGSHRRTVGKPAEIAAPAKVEEAPPADAVAPEAAPAEDQGEFTPGNRTASAASDRPVAPFSGTQEPYQVAPPGTEEILGHARAWSRRALQLADSLPVPLEESVRNASSGPEVRAYRAKHPEHQILSMSSTESYRADRRALAQVRRTLRKELEAFPVPAGLPSGARPEDRVVMAEAYAATTSLTDRVFHAFNLTGRSAPDKERDALLGRLDALWKAGGLDALLRSSGPNGDRHAPLGVARAALHHPDAEIRHLAARWALYMGLAGAVTSGRKRAVEHVLRGAFYMGSVSDIGGQARKSVEAVPDDASGPKLLGALDAVLGGDPVWAGLRTELEQPRLPLRLDEVRSLGRARFPEDLRAQLRGLSQVERTALARLGRLHDSGDARGDAAFAAARGDLDTKLPDLHRLLLALEAQLAAWKAPVAADSAALLALATLVSSSREGRIPGGLRTSQELGDALRFSTVPLLLPLMRLEAAPAFFGTVTSFEQGYLALPSSPHDATLRQTAYTVLGHCLQWLSGAAADEHVRALAKIRDVRDLKWNRELIAPMGFAALQGPVHLATATLAVPSVVEWTLGLLEALNRPFSNFHLALPVH